MSLGYTWQLLYSLYTCNRAQEQAQSTQHCPQENPVRIILISNKHDQKMDIIITYDAVRTLLANPPSLNPRANFFNICKLRSHFARALKKIPCSQSPVNGWARAVMSPEMYVLINFNLFHLNIEPTTATLAYQIKYNPDGAIVPYTSKIHHQCKIFHG